MIIIPCEQGSPEWLAARVGIPTASNFDRIITPKTMKLSQSADSYMCELLAEWMLAASLDSYVSEWMQRGKDLEDSAIAYYELQRDIETEKVGFLVHDDLLAGCSPDRLVGDDGGLEIKCPSPAKHVANLLEMTNQYRAQVQGALWITGRKWWDLMSFHPDMPTALVRFERDEEFITALNGAVNAFAQRMIEARQLMVDRGYAPQIVRAA
jgi:hypothetical protein